MAFLGDVKNETAAFEDLLKLRSLYQKMKRYADKIDDHVKSIQGKADYQSILGDTVYNQAATLVQYARNFPELEEMKKIKGV